MEYVYLQPEDKIVIGAKTNYAKLFGNDWCPLFSSIHLAGIVDERSSAMISESIIFDAREILGIKPCQLPLTEAEIKLFESSGRLKDTPKYPQWKIDIAQNILRIHPRVKNEADIVGFEEDGHPIRTNEPLDEIWEAAVGIVKKSIAPRLNEEIKDYHILSILAIAEAWDALKNFLYGKEKENNSDIMRQLQVAGKLLSKAKELSLEEKNKLLKQDAENVKNNMYKMMANQEGVYGQINKTKKAVEPILYQKTPKDAKWQDLTMAFPNHIEDKVDICFKGKQKETVFLKDLGFVDKKATKIFKPLESLVLLKRFA